MNSGLRILLIDDNPGDRILIMREMSREFPDLRVEQIAEPEDLARALEAGNFDLAITDYRLHWTDGLAVLRAIKTRWPDRPVVMFTATGTQEVAVEAMKAGLSDYVIKAPKHFARLPAAVRSALEKVRERQARREAESRYRCLFDRVPVGLYRTTPEGRILDANLAMVQMLGYPGRESLLVANAADLYVDPEDRREWQALMEPQGIVRDFEVRFRRRDGTIIWMRDSSRAVQDHEGQVRYYEGSLEEITERKRAEEELRESYAKLQRALEVTIHTLVSAIEMRDPYTAGHQRRVTQLTCAIAKEMGLPKERIEGLRMAGLIHDIGKINIPAEILSKPGRLTELESGLIQAHVRVGGDVLNGTTEFPWPVAEIVLQHHERLDGSGYPASLLREDILLEAKILAVADVVEAMASHRPYRSARGIDQALEEISQNKDVLYDADVVDTCLRLFSEKGFEFEQDYEMGR